jgi:hypothetical protein
MAKLSSAEIVEKQIRTAADRLEDLRKGIRESVKNPMERAKKRKEKMRRNFNKALEDGTWEAGLDSISHETYKRITEEKAGERYVSGLESARDVMLDFQEQIKPVRDALEKKIDGMPDDTYENREARMLANARGLRQFKFRRKRR